MTFSADEKTTHDGQPIMLWDFNLRGGDASNYYYTNYTSDLSVLSHTYTSAAISRERLAATSHRSSRSEMIVSMPYDLAIVDEVIKKEPPRGIELQVRRYHGTIANVSLIWKGLVRSVRVVGYRCEMRIPSTLIESLQSEVPSIVGQTMCNHVLYDTRCGVSRAANTTSTTVAGISSSDTRIITVTSLGGAADQVFRGGEVIRTTDGERRLIVDQTGTTITLVRSFRNLAVTDAIDAAKGCDHLVATCNSKFLNLANFGGMPYIPAEDVFRWGV